MVTNKIKRRLLRARVVLNQAIRQILEINRIRKQLPFFQNREAKEKEIEQELKLLNKIAQQQAVLIKKYEEELETTGWKSSERLRLPQRFRQTLSKSLW